MQDNIVLFNSQTNLRYS